ncbi:oxidoreductase [Streptomyces sp. NBC_00038]|uniref:oxidoreductase n=1 Tax=Streptomyces sp. NBC_00038 TaxID=2903615 RepID=UPI0022560618|nr:oxidoreductase [Streptomyces sp. NBC_00038]MCX5557364.1 oxidoreductase [Streptomyces sp. NBC_00038]
MSKTWLITGSSRGLGRALAEAVLTAGHQLVATARKPEQLDDLVRRFGDQVRAVALDVTDPAAARAAVRHAVDSFGRLDVLVNNAGYADVASIEDVTEDAFRAQIDTNLHGVVNVTKAALPVLREQGSGHIVQISSVGGRVGTPGLSAYQAAKWAVGGFSEVLAQEVAPFGIKVTVIEPGGLRTDWAGSSMSTPPISDPYKPVIEPMAGFLSQADGTQPGDPARAAQAILHVTEAADPPVRLLLGSDAVAVAGAMAQNLAASDAKWRKVSESIDFDA